MLEAATTLVVDHAGSSGAEVSHVRGALIVSSLQTLRELKLYERYLTQLPSGMHESVLYALASSWVPREAAMAHYAACDAMSLSEPELGAIGERVCNRIMGTFMSTLLRGARPSGANVAAIALPAYPRIYDRVMQGGRVLIHLTGPKDATIETRGIAMFRYRYFRLAHHALVRGAGLMMTKAFYVRQIKASDIATTLALSWV
ncbi:MAG: hypothetical protein ABW252_21560 [Polyangiales bacterium]